MKSDNSLNFNDLKSAFEYRTNKELKKANFLFTLINHPTLSLMMRSMAKVSIKLHLPVKPIIRATVFDHFCGGESIQDSQKTVERIGKYRVRTILDYSVEGEETEEGFDKTKSEILHIIDRAVGSENVPFTVFKMTGLAAFHLLERVQSGQALSDEEKAAFKRVQSRVDEVCGYAASKGVPIMIDAEESWIQNPIDELAYEMMRKYNSEKALVFNTYQMYRVDSLRNLEEASRKLNQDGKYFGAKLVRGAYMEKERERAEDMGYPSPIHVDKQATDNCFDDGLTYCMENREMISVVCGSHNEKSNLLLARLMNENAISHQDTRFWFAQLYGMSDNISFNLAKAGFNVAKYVPYGPVLSVMPYLLRRAEENTSVAGQSSRELNMIRVELANRKNGKK